MTRIPAVRILLALAMAVASWGVVASEIPIEIEETQYDGAAEALKVEVRNASTESLSAWGIDIFVSHPDGSTQEFTEAIDRLPRAMRSGAWAAFLGPGDRYLFEIPFRLEGEPRSLGAFHVQASHAITSEVETFGDQEAVEQALAVRLGWLDAARFTVEALAGGRAVEAEISRRLEDTAARLRSLRASLENGEPQSLSSTRVFHEHATLRDLLERSNSKTAADLKDELEAAITVTLRHIPGEQKERNQ